MLRRTLLARVHLFAALVPKAQPTDGNYFTPEQLTEAQTAIAERKDILAAADLSKCIERLQSISNVRQRHDLIQDFSKAVEAYRAELYKRTSTDPSDRLQLHEAIMAAGFYQRVIVVNELQNEAVRFVLNHYNFDVRRDTTITTAVHSTLHEDKEATAESDKLLGDLLLLERRLSGAYRLAPTGGRRWLVLGQALSEVKSREDMEWFLSLAPVKEVGNFAMSEADTDKLWVTATVVPKTETERSFIEAAGLHTSIKEEDTRLELRIQKPKKPLDFWERLSDTLMRYWVIWFSMWVMFFMVDEEIITIIALIFLKQRQTAILEAEAEKTGGKVYVATSTGRFS